MPLKLSKNKKLDIFYDRANLYIEMAQKDLTSEDGDESQETFVNSKKNLISIFGGINPIMAGQVIRGILSVKNKKTIKLHIYSEGGTVEAGFAIYDTLKSIKNPTEITVFGTCSSIATLILQGADKRRAMPHSEFFIHEFSINTECSVSEYSSKYIELEKQYDQYLSILSNRTTLNKKKIKKLCEKSTTFSAKRALEWGFLDELVCEI